MRQPRPVYRGQGNQPQQIARPDGPTYPGQTAPYDVNGAPAGGDADTLDGQDGTFYLARANHIGTQAAATISDFAAAVNALIAATYTAADVLAKLLTVDGTGSGLDADLLDGQSGAHYLDRANHTGTQAQATITNLVADLAAKLDAASYTAADVLTKVKTVDGSGSGLDADLLRGTTPTAFGLTLIDDADAAAGRATLGLGAVAVETYATGTFTPGITFGGAAVDVTTATASGRYTRIGRTVTVDITLVLTSKGSSTGTALITGLPFAAPATPPNVIGSALANSLTTVTNLAVAVAGSTSTIQLFDNTGTGFASLTDADVNNDSQFFISLTYTI